MRDRSAGELGRGRRAHGAHPARDHGADARLQRRGGGRDEPAAVCRGCRHPGAVRQGARRSPSRWASRCRGSIAAAARTGISPRRWVCRRWMVLAVPARARTPATSTYCGSTWRRARPSWRDCWRRWNRSALAPSHAVQFAGLHHRLPADRAGRSTTRLRWHRVARQVVVVLASLAFYGWWDIRFVPLLAGLTVANWLIAQWFGASRARWIPVFGVVLNLAVLGAVQIRGLLPRHRRSTCLARRSIHGGSSCRSASASSCSRRSPI